MEDFLSPEENLRMPWVVLHELAHGFHDQTIGFDDPRVTAAWRHFCDSGKYKSVLTTSGNMHEHYGLTDQKEFFAEMTECYFGSNDFYPFVSEFRSSGSGPARRVPGAESALSYG